VSGLTRRPAVRACGSQRAVGSDAIWSRSQPSCIGKSPHNRRGNARGRAVLWLTHACRSVDCEQSPSDYDVETLRCLASAVRNDSPVDAARFEVTLSQAVATFLTDLHTGRVDPTSIGLDFPIVKDPPGLASLAHGRSPRLIGFDCTLGEATLRVCRARATRVGRGSGHRARPRVRINPTAGRGGPDRRPGRGASFLASGSLAERCLRLPGFNEPPLR